MQTDLIFHEAIARGTHNSIFIALFDAAFSRLAEQRLVLLDSPGAYKV